MAPDRDEQTKQALITSLRLLAASPKSRQELATKLEAKGYSDQAIQNALHELGEQGVLDDRIYAKNLLNRLIQGKGSGRHKIAFELKRHKIPEKLRHELLAAMPESSERDRAFELAAAKWPQLFKLERHKRKKKLFDYLVRKGYDFQTVHDVLETLEKGAADELNESV